jgi:hypothetical protein
MLNVVEKKVQGRGRPSDISRVREFAFCDEIFEGGTALPVGTHYPDICLDLRQFLPLPRDLLRMTPVLPAEIEHCGRGPRVLLSCLPCSKDGMKVLSTHSVTLLADRLRIKRRVILRSECDSRTP